MKSFWKVATFILTGLIAGIILTNKLSLGVDTLYKGSFRFKQKGRHNTQDNKVKPEIALKTRKSDRILSKLERQKDRAQKKIEKQHN